MQINRYAAFLHNPSNAMALWGARLVLLAAVILHIVSSMQLLESESRGAPCNGDYQKKADVPSNYASRTMMWSGPIIAAFVIFHVLHLTVGAVLPLRDVGGNAINQPDVRYNVISGFQNPLVAGFYIFAMILLCTHLYHGIYSMFQSLGISHPQYTPKLKQGAKIVAILIAIGNCSIPIAVMTGLLTN